MKLASQMHGIMFIPRLQDLHYVGLVLAATYIESN